MSEISKLRARLKNVQKNVTEYRMTVREAQDLLKEIDSIAVKKPTPVEIVNVPATPVVKIIDGGTFT